MHPLKKSTVLLWGSALILLVCVLAIILRSTNKHLLGSLYVGAKIVDGYPTHFLIDTPFSYSYRLDAGERMYLQCANEPLPSGMQWASPRDFPGLKVYEYSTNYAYEKERVGQRWVGARFPTYGDSDILFSFKPGRSYALYATQDIPQIGCVVPLPVLSSSSSRSSSSATSSSSTGASSSSSQENSSTSTSSLQSDQLPIAFDPELPFSLLWRKSSGETGRFFSTDDAISAFAIDDVNKSVYWRYVSDDIIGFSWLDKDGLCHSTVTANTGVHTGPNNTQSSLLVDGGRGVIFWHSSIDGKGFHLSNLDGSSPRTVDPNGINDTEITLGAIDPARNTLYVLAGKTPYAYSLDGLIGGTDITSRRIFNDTQYEYSGMQVDNQTGYLYFIRRAVNPPPSGIIMSLLKYDPISQQTAIGQYHYRGGLFGYSPDAFLSIDHTTGELLLSGPDAYSATAYSLISLEEIGGNPLTDVGARPIRNALQISNEGLEILPGGGRWCPIHESSSSSIASSPSLTGLDWIASSSDLNIHEPGIFFVTLREAGSPRYSLLFLPNAINAKPIVLASSTSHILSIIDAQSDRAFIRVSLPNTFNSSIIYEVGKGSVQRLSFGEIPVSILETQSHRYFSYYSYGDIDGPYPGQKIEIHRSNLDGSNEIIVGKIEDAETRNGRLDVVDMQIDDFTQKLFVATTYLGIKSFDIGSSFFPVAGIGVYDPSPPNTANFDRTGNMLGFEKIGSDLYTVEEDDLIDLFDPQNAKLYKNGVPQFSLLTNQESIPHFEFRDSTIYYTKSLQPCWLAQTHVNGVLTTLDCSYPDYSTIKERLVEIR